MGLIKAGIGALGGVLADQWKDDWSGPQRVCISRAGPAAPGLGILLQRGGSRPLGVQLPFPGTDGQGG